MKTITVFTPTYNRGFCLGQVYESLCRQTSNDFEWLIIDDGSTDNTRELVTTWMRDSLIEIQYQYKANGGLHTGYNAAIEIIQTELCICIDSDDYMPDDAVSKILNYWLINKSEEYAGIIGLDFYKGGKSIGGDLPKIKSVRYIDLIDKYKYKGDTKMVHRTKLLKKFVPMPTIKNEKNFNPIYIFLQVDSTHPLLILNENLCFVDYQDDGMSNNIFNQYVNSPNSFAELRRVYMALDNVSSLFVFRHAIHYISSSLFARDFDFLRKSPKKMMTLCAIPFGIALSIYIKIKTN